MNKSKIDWTDYSWNPLTGCKNKCSYCYARRQSKRFSGDVRLNKASDQCRYNNELGLYVLDKPFVTRGNRSLNYPFGFDPTFHKYRLDWPSKIKNGRNIFVGSMTDLFGEWVPDKVIKMVFEACERYKQHNYMFLTKNPQRYSSLMYADKLPRKANMWYGSTVTDPQMPLFGVGGYNTFLSIEPLLAPFPGIEFSLNYPKWVIIGAETGNRKDKIIPQKEWIQEIVSHCRAIEVPVFMKESIQELMGDEFIQQYPGGLKIQRNVDSQRNSAWYMKMYGKCALCKCEKRKNDMIAILVRGKRGTGSKQLAYACKDCYQDLCEYLEVNPAELEF